MRQRWQQQHRVVGQLVCDSKLVAVHEIPSANDPQFVQQRCRTLPITQTVSSIPGYPTKLKIFLTNASRYWQVRCFFAPGAQGDHPQPAHNQQAGRCGTGETFL